MRGKRCQNETREERAVYVSSTGKMLYSTSYPQRKKLALIHVVARIIFTSFGSLSFFDEGLRKETAANPPQNLHNSSTRP